MTFSRPVRSLLLFILCLATFGSIANAQTKPGRDPNQTVDQEYTNKIREYTTAPHFNSPLTDYLPASPGVPTPLQVLGHIAGAADWLPYSADVYRYFRALDTASPRVKVFSIGKTEEGREMIAVAIADEALLAEMGIEDPFELTGVYEGLPLHEKSISHSGTMPDRIRLFRQPILDEWIARGDETLEHLVTHVLVHEVGHHFGLSDEAMHALEEAAG